MTFEEIYKAYWYKVFRICMGYVNDHDWAKDIAQDTFVSIWRQLPKFRQEAAIGTWIFRIASNHCLRQIERGNRMPRAEMPAHIADHMEPDREPQVKFLYKCIAGLPETDRLIISLELEDVRQAEIARIMGLTETNIRVRVHRIKEKSTKNSKIMSAEIDFKTLWNKEEAKDIPNTKELLRKAGSLRKAARIRLIIQSLVLSAVLALLLTIGFNMDNKQATTNIGLSLMLMAIASYMVVSGQLFPVLYKSDIESSSREYLSQLIRIKRKNEFLDKVMVDIYFSLLSLGVFLYMLQFAIKLGTARAVFCYVIIFVCLAASWYHSRTREIKKTIKPLNDTIKRLEALNEQLHNCD